MTKIKQFIKKYEKMPVVARASLWFVICGFMTRGVSLLTTPIFTRLLTTEQYGVYSVFNSWLEIVTIFASLKLGYGVYIQGLVKFNDDQDRFSSSLLGLATTWCGGVFLIYLLFHKTFNSLLGLETPMMVCMFIMVISTVALDFWSARKRNEFKYATLVKVTMFIVAMKPVLGIIAVLLTNDAYKVEARIATLALVELAVGVILYIQIMSRGHEYYNKKYWKYALLINLPLVPHFLSQVILNHSDRIMIQKMVGESAAGVYSLAYSMAMILSMINTSILQAIRPWVFQRIKAGEKEKIQPVVVSAILVVAFCNIMLISFAPELVAIFAPGSYSGAIDLMPPITLAVLFAFLYNLFVDIEMYFEKTKSVMNIAIVCAAINLITNYFGIMWFGYAAVAYTTLACYILMAILHYCSMERMLRKNNIKGKIYDAKIIVAISLAYVLIGTVMGVLSGHLFLRLIVMAILAVVLYLNRSRFTQIFVLIKNKRH